MLTRLAAAAHVERVVGLWALGSLLQTWVGSHLVHAPAPVRAVAPEWTTTGRLSVWAHGQFALHDPSGRLHDWLRETLQAGAARLQQEAMASAPPALAPAA